jgi:TetR/AcrR family transcriptional regulator
MASSAMDNRSQILEVALEAFARKGYEAVGVQEVATAAGLTKPTLYHYFGNKIGLLEEVLRSYNERLLADLGCATDYHGDLPLTLNKVARAYFRAACLSPRHFCLQNALLYAPRESEAGQLANRFAARQQQLLEHLFEQAAFDHGNMRGRHRAYGLTFAAMMGSYALLAIRDGESIDDDLAFRAVHQFMHGIFS